MSTVYIATRGSQYGNENATFTANGETRQFPLYLSKNQGQELFKYAGCISPSGLPVYDLVDRSIHPSRVSVSESRSATAPAQGLGGQSAFKGLKSEPTSQRGTPHVMKGPEPVESTFDVNRATEAARLSGFLGCQDSEPFKQSGLKSDMPPLDQGSRTVIVPPSQRVSSSPQTPARNFAIVSLIAGKAPR